MAVGRMIRILRKQAGLTQQELANRVGMERTSICNIELGHQILTEKSIVAIADALGYEIHVTFKRKRGHPNDCKH
jgi:transcriptional regulator with XRE-family HTH domain